MAAETSIAVSDFAVYKERHVTNARSIDLGRLVASECCQGQHTNDCSSTQHTIADRNEVIDCF